MRYKEVIREVLIHNVGDDYIFVTLWNQCDTFNFNSVLVSRTSPRRWPDYWPKHVAEDTVNKNTS